MISDSERREVARSRVTEARRALDRAMWALSVPETDWEKVEGEADKVIDLMCILWSESATAMCWRAAEREGRRHDG